MTTHTGAGKLAGSAAASISSASMPPAEPPMTTIRCVDTRLRCHIRKVRARFGRHRMVGAATHPQCTSHLVTRWISPLARRTLGSKVSVRRLSQSIRRQRRARLVMSGPCTPPSGRLPGQLSVPKCTRKTPGPAHTDSGARLSMDQCGATPEAIFQQRPCCSKGGVRAARLHETRGTVWETGAARRTR